MDGSKSLIDLLGVYDNSEEPMPMWNHRSVMLGIPISFIVSTPRLCYPWAVLVC